MEVSRLLSIIRIKLSDPLYNGSDTQSLFKTDELLYYINNALREVVFRGKLLLKDTYSIKLKTGVSEYKTPYNTTIVTRIVDENKLKLDKVHEPDLQFITDDWRNDTDYLPTKFIQTLNNKLIFYPTPSKDSTVVVQANCMSPELEQCDEIPTELSELYHQDLIYWALHEAYGKQDGDVLDSNASEINRIRFNEVFGEKPSANQLQDILEYPDNPGSLRDIF